MHHATPRLLRVGAWRRLARRQMPRVAPRACAESASSGRGCNVQRRYFVLAMSVLYYRRSAKPKGGANLEAFHAFRRACGFYSWYRLRPAWWAPAKSKDIAARARSFRVRQFAWLIEAPRRSSAIGTEVLAGGHKSDCRSTAGEDQQGLRFCGLEGRRCMQ